MRNTYRAVRPPTRKILFFLLILVIGMALSACNGRNENSVGSTNSTAGNSASTGAAAPTGQSSARRVADQAKEDSKNP